jgi:hypothetical protein
VVAPVGQSGQAAEWAAEEWAGRESVWQSGQETVWRSGRESVWQSGRESVWQSGQESVWQSGREPDRETDTHPCPLGSKYDMEWALEPGMVQV